MAQLHGSFTQRLLTGMLSAQSQQAIGQCRQGPKQGIPEDHRKEALIGLPQQMPLNPLQQFTLAVGIDIQIAPRHQVSRLGITAPPAVAKRPQGRLQVAPPQAVDHHPQVHGQGQPAIGQGFEQQQSQRQYQQRPQYQERQYQPGAARPA